MRAIQHLRVTTFARTSSWRLVPYGVYNRIAYSCGDSLDLLLELLDFPIEMEEKVEFPLGGSFRNWEQVNCYGTAVAQPRRHADSYGRTTCRALTH